MHWKFTNRHLFIVVALFAILTWFFANGLTRSAPISEAEQKIVDEILQNNEFCFLQAHEYGFPEGTSFVLSIHVRCPDTDALLESLCSQLANLRRVDIYAAGTNLTDDGLRSLRRLKCLRELMVDNTKCTPHGIMTLRIASSRVKIVHTTSK